LENHHGYIQWLFPLFAKEGMNMAAYPLSKVSNAQQQAHRASKKKKKPISVPLSVLLGG